MDKGREERPMKVPEGMVEIQQKLSDVGLNNDPLRVIGTPYVPIDRLQVMEAKCNKAYADLDLADMFITVQKLRIEMQAKELKEKQASIDELMLEYCPGEMTPSQVTEWAKNQQLAPTWAKNQQLAPTMKVVQVSAAPVTTSLEQQLKK